MRRLAFLFHRVGWLAALPLLFWLGGFVWFIGSGFWVKVDRVSRTDAIVVLTGGKSRLTTGLHLLAAGKAEKLFVSGVNPAVDLDTLLRSLGPDAKREACCIVLGHTANNTVGNALETAAWIQQEGYRSLRLVTSWYHMRRSLLELRQAIPNVRIVAHPVFARDGDPDDWHGWVAAGQVVLAEYNKFLVAWLLHLVEDRPKAPAEPVVRTVTPGIEGDPGSLRL